MPAPPVNLYPDESKMARIRRELRNPSMVTVILMVVAVLAVPTAFLLPSWISTTQESLQRRSDADAARDQTLISASALVPSQIVPWMLNSIEVMRNATSPVQWRAVDFRQGPCAEKNLAQLPTGRYADAIAKSCGDLYETQRYHNGDCTSIATCEISAEAHVELDTIRADLISIFSDAGFVLPYSEREEQPGP